MAVDAKLGKDVLDTRVMKGMFKDQMIGEFEQR